MVSGSLARAPRLLTFWSGVVGFLRFTLRCLPGWHCGLFECCIQFAQVDASLWSGLLKHTDCDSVLFPVTSLHCQQRWSVRVPQSSRRLPSWFIRFDASHSLLVHFLFLHFLLFHLFHYSKWISGVCWGFRFQDHLGVFLGIPLSLSPFCHC